MCVIRNFGHDGNAISSIWIVNFSNSAGGDVMTQDKPSFKLVMFYTLAGLVFLAAILYDKFDGVLNTLDFLYGVFK